MDSVVAADAAKTAAATIVPGETASVPRISNRSAVAGAAAAAAAVATVALAVAAAVAATSPAVGEGILRLSDICSFAREFSINCPR